ncbi:hypothetical protein [Bacteroides reticulotermitis]|uniref:hypothetical protein n=1 Tax=Bacteroides reticulotermitis TaxID=1133319 RepID=UPI003A83F7B8
MILYDSLLAKAILNKKKENVMIFGINFTKKKYLEPCKEMEMMIYRKIYFECILLALVPALIPSVLISWWFMLLVPMMYYILYSIEWVILLFSSKAKTSRRDHLGNYLSAFDLEAKVNNYDLLYLRKRKSWAWTKLYGKVDTQYLERE